MRWVRQRQRSYRYRVVSEGFNRTRNKKVTAEAEFCLFQAVRLRQFKERYGINVGLDMIGEMLTRPAKLW
jgi:hypothetical protein